MQTNSPKLSPTDYALALLHLAKADLDKGLYGQVKGYVELALLTIPATNPDGIQAILANLNAKPYPDERCKKCGGSMRPGDYLKQTLTGMPDFIGCTEVCTVSPGGPGKLMKDGCMKCEKCGWSVT
jgi:hypothetical protein